MTETLHGRFEALVVGFQLLDFFSEGLDGNQLQLHDLIVVWLVQGFLHHSFQPGRQPEWFPEACSHVIELYMSQR